MFNFKKYCKKLLNWNILIFSLIIYNGFGLKTLFVIAADNGPTDAVTLDLNSKDTLKSLEALIETVRKIRADTDDTGTGVLRGTDLTTAENIEIETIIPTTEKSTSTTTTTRSTTTEAPDANLLDLESSFGGLGNVREVKQPQKLNGFYFLADINSFLEVGDGDEKVVVRFNPKIGNPSNFIPIPGSRTQL